MEGQHEQEENPQRRVYLDQPEDHRSDQDAHDNLQHDRRKLQESVTNPRPSGTAKAPAATTSTPVS